jgi:hypothetical protein
MKIEFEWKNFEIEKPIVGSKVIFKHNGKIVFGIYNGDVSDSYEKKGIWKDGRNFPIYNFIGSELNYKSLNKKTQLSYPIYTKWSYSFETFKEAKMNLSETEHNPYDFEWNYYCDNWL